MWIFLMNPVVSIVKNISHVVEGSLSYGFAQDEVILADVIRLPLLCQLEQVLTCFNH